MIEQNVSSFRVLNLTLDRCVFILTAIHARPNQQELTPSIISLIVPYFHERVSFHHPPQKLIARFGMKYRGDPDHWPCFSGVYLFWIICVLTIPKHFQQCKFVHCLHFLLESLICVSAIASGIQWKLLSVFRIMYYSTINHITTIIIEYIRTQLCEFHHPDCSTSHCSARLLCASRSRLLPGWIAERMQVIVFYTAKIYLMVSSPVERSPAVLANDDVVQWTCLSYS